VDVHQPVPDELAKQGVTSKQDPQTDGSGDATSALHLHVEDYLYTVDGMDVWRTIEGWVRSYFARLYHSDATVATTRSYRRGGPTSAGSAMATASATWRAG
jgi:hypothetical protein